VLDPVRPDVSVERERVPAEPEEQDRAGAERKRHRHDGANEAVEHATGAGGTRARLREAARGQRFLNLFAYTGTATVYAVAGGAVSATSVDMSRTYLAWAQRNLALNDLSAPAHAFVQAECRAWLRDAVRGPARYDLVFLDPPTFSNSKRMEGVLDVERDHGSLIDACAKLLAPGGLLVFSTNAQRFKLDEALATRYAIRDISAATLPRDFERNPRIHRCFEIRLNKSR